jgi:NADPH:quinone reductase-like Zn-dependent oxidoreductase
LTEARLGDHAAGYASPADASLQRLRMRKVVIHRPGGHDRLTIEEHPDPKPGPGEVLIEVAAAGVNYADCMVRMGLYKSARDHGGYPITPGFEVAGRIAAAGAGVTEWKAGDRALAVPLFGGYTTRLAVPVHQVFPIPDGLSCEQAAAIPCVFLTAYYALFLLCSPAPPGSGEQTMLVHSAAGGVGGALAQLGRVAGCRVVGVVGGAHKVDSARAFGAGEVIDASSDDLWAAARSHAPQGYDFIFDANGVATLRRSYDHLASPGRLVVYGFHTMLGKGRQRPSWIKLLAGWLRTPRFDPLDMTNKNRSVLAFNLSYQFDRTEQLAESMDRLLGWLQDGSLQPPPVTAFAFDAAAAAHRAIESGRTVGKLVLVSGR